MRCVLCRKTISGGFYANPLFGDVACAPCGADSACRWCGHYRPLRDHFDYSSCDACRSISIECDEDLDRLRNLTLPIIFEHFGVVSYGTLPIMFGPERPEALGEAWFGGSNNHIRLRQGMPIGVAVGVLAHEYGHMLANLEPDSLAPRPSAGTHDNVLEEGFCEVLCALGLLTQPSDDARWMSFLMPANPDPVYGDGFRLMWARAEELGSAADLLESLTEQEHLHRHPLRGATLEDDFVIPDDIAPLVDIGSGDRDKGPLRGTALLSKDLPVDAPSGPRLRGRGLVGTDRGPLAETLVALKGTLRGTALRDTEPDSVTPSVRKVPLRGKGLGPKP